MLERKITSAQFQDLAREILEKDSSLRFRARGSSMQPFIQDNDLLEVAALSGGEARLGDVVVFNLENERLLVHRVVRIHRKGNEHRLLLQGDAHLYPDGWVDPRRVFGRVTAYQRSGRWHRLDTPAWGLFAFLLASGLPVIKTGLRILRKP